LKLGLVISSLRCGGAERVMAQLANHWANRGDQVTLVTLDSAASDWFELHPRVKRVALGVMSHSGAFGRAIISNVVRLWVLRRALVATGASVIVSFEECTNVLVLLASLWAQLTLVICERNDPRSHRIGKAWSLLRTLTYPFADALVVQTKALLPWAHSIMRGRHHVEAIPNPVRAMEGYAPALPRERKRIVSVGRLAPQKGHDVLLRAFAEVAREHPDWTLTIVGEGPQRQTLLQLAAALGIAEQVEFRGWVPEPGEVLAASDVFVMASRYEGFPNALLEAMACGLPVISTHSVGAQEIVTDGYDGLLTPVGDELALAAAMRRLIEDPALRARLARSGMEVSERYSLERVVAQWDAALAAAMRR
jgi:GalNAc-alpha-(1->4)-GalNAc-alpha-(1->3)-diNAcBac-PP-undecaprenol alpha-1,4-N-acetyl-D-galactosaminyltransferase